MAKSPPYTSWEVQTRPVIAQGLPGEHSQSWDLVLGGPARSRELDSMIPKGPFQLEIFHEVGGRVQTSQEPGRPSDHTGPSQER